MYCMNLSIPLESVIIYSVNKMICHDEGQFNENIKFNAKLPFHLREETTECPQAFKDSHLPRIHPCRLTSQEMPPQTFTNSQNSHYHLSREDIVPCIIRQLPSVQIVAFKEKTGSRLGQDHDLQQEMTVLFFEHLVHSWHYAKCIPTLVHLILIRTTCLTNSRIKFDSSVDQNCWC